MTIELFQWLALAAAFFIAAGYAWHACELRRSTRTYNRAISCLERLEEERVRHVTEVHVLPPEEDGEIGRGLNGTRLRDRQRDAS